MKNIIKAASLLRKSAAYSRADRVVAEKRLPSLTACILLDIIGCVTNIPFVGLIWAPISALIYWRMFGFRKGFLGGWFSLFEELIPGLDLIPTFTITWVLQYMKRNKTSFIFNPNIRL